MRVRFNDLENLMDEWYKKNDKTRAVLQPEYTTRNATIELDLETKQGFFWGKRLKRLAASVSEQTPWDQTSGMILHEHNWRFASRAQAEIHLGPYTFIHDSRDFSDTEPRTYLGLKDAPAEAQQEIMKRVLDTLEIKGAADTQKEGFRKLANQFVDFTNEKHEQVLQDLYETNESFTYTSRTNSSMLQFTHRARQQGREFTQAAQVTQGLYRTSRYADARRELTHFLLHSHQEITSAQDYELINT